MNELVGHQLELLRKDTEFALYRGKQGTGAPTLLLVPAADRPAAASLGRLEHEYSLADKLNAAWAVRPLALERHDGGMILVLEDSGGDPLDRALASQLDLTRFLRLGAALAAALRETHRSGLVHRDIKPANVLVDAAGNVRLTGFGIASQLPRERPDPAPPEVIAGTFAYMAPEQTGRMNRSIDARSDLYSLGVTLYQALTGSLPFTASEPMEWIHCHIARQPAPPSERAEGIPVPVAAIVMKLLAKTAEERYQTAAGVEADLRRCLAEWEAQGRIDPFLLGVHDASDQLLIPEKLYGREAEIELLLSAFDRVVQDGAPRMVLVSGYAGIGKSSVVNELHKAVASSHGLFASGKFDQYKRDIPYSTVALAFRSLVRQLLEKSDIELQGWRRALLEALGQNGELLVSLIPELEHIIGKQPPVAILAPQEAQARFQLVFRRFLSVFATPEHPLALFFDDLQWLDAATLQLMEYLIKDPEVSHVLFVGAYRDNEVNTAHPLTKTLEALRRTGVKIQHILVTPLRSADVTRLIADSLHCERDRAEPLAQLVYEKTDGNPFFAIQFITMLADERLLAFNHETSGWDWNIERIRSKGLSENVADLVARKLDRLPDRTQKAIKLFACLGNTAEADTLAAILRQPSDALNAALGEAVRAGLVFRSGSSYTFLHDRVREAAYEMIPPNTRAQVHLDIGRVLSSLTAPAEFEEKLFEIVNQFNCGSALIYSPEERLRAAELNLMAGKRAMTSAAYASALAYLVSGHALLAEDSWERQHRLVFDLELHRSECEFLTGNAIAAKRRLLVLTEHASSLVDRAAVARILLPLYLTVGQPYDAIDVALEYLGHVDIKWSRYPTADAVQQEYERIWQQIGDRQIEALVDLPVMTNSDSRATVDVLTDLICPALYCDEKLSYLAVGRIANLSLEHGNTDASCIAYAYLNMAFGAFFGDYQSGYRFGKLGLDLAEERGLSRFKARVQMAFGNLVIPWTKDVRMGQSLVRSGFDAAMEDGDVAHAAFCCNHLITNLIGSGEPLGDVLREAEERFDFVQKRKFGFVTDVITGQLALVRVLRGQKPRFESIDGTEFDEDQFERHLEEDPQLANAACWYWIRKLQALFFSDENGAAVEAARKAQDLLWTSPSFFEGAEYHFFSALARAAHYGEMSPTEQAGYFEAISEHRRQVELWAKNCPENFSGRAALIAAEMARIESRELDAERLYENAIRLSHDNGFIHIEAIAHELAGRFYLARGFDTIANAYLRNARYCYDRWGALGKVRQLEQRYPHLHDERTTASASGTVITPVEGLELATLLKVSQAVSSEIVLDKLIERLMVLALEHAGAERGLLMLSRGSELHIEAVAVTDNNTVSVRLHQTPVTATSLPLSVLRYVVRAKDNVILHDASAADQFSADEYIRATHARSIFCLPLLKQAKLIGALYLENNLTPHAFTAGRVALLGLLASQAAISLESARLNIDLQQAQADLLHAARLTTIGQLAASISHEVSQPLMAIATNAQSCMGWLAREPSDVEKARRAAERIALNAQRAGEVIASVRALARKSPPEMVQLDINAVIEDILQLLHAELRRHNVLLETELAGGLELRVGDRVQLQQVIANLVMNGIEAMSTIAGRPRTLRIETSINDDGNILVSVADTGVGLGLEDETRIFDAFYTTKREGMGMGLSICRSIVEAHGGRLWASRRAPHGSVFHFILPRNGTP